jgi:hypothetical protein
MKYVISWETRQNTTEEMQERGLTVFSKWAPAEGVTFHQFLGRIDGQGGYAVVETDNPELIAHDMATFGAFFDMSVHPCLEIQDIARIGGAAVEFLHSVS